MNKLIVIVLLLLTACVRQAPTPAPVVVADLPFIEVHCTHNAPIRDDTVTVECDVSGAPEDAVIRGIEVFSRITHECLGDLYVGVGRGDIKQLLWDRPEVCPLDMHLDDDPQNDGDIEFGYPPNIPGRHVHVLDGQPVNQPIEMLVIDDMAFSYGTIDRTAYLVYYVTGPALRVVPDELSYTYDLSSAAQAQEVVSISSVITPTRVVVSTSDTIQAYSQIPGVEIKRPLNTGFAAIVTKDGLDELRKDPSIISVVPDIRVNTQLNHSIPLINADDVHALGYTGEGVSVAVLDTGIDRNHPDLEDSIVGGRCFGDCPNSYEDDNGHGTAVSGIITSNSRGVAPEAGIAAVKVLDRNGGGWMSDIQAGIEWATRNQERFNIRAINMSLGGGGQYGHNCDFVMPSFTNAIHAANNAGITVFAASGNEFARIGVSVPACISGVMSVGVVWDQSHGQNPCNYPKRPDVPACYGNTGPNLDVMAPTANRTTGVGGGEINNFGGTSAAAPHAAAVAALMLDANPFMSPELVEQRMEMSGITVTHPETGATFSRIDALAAILSTGFNVSNIGAGTLEVSIEAPDVCWLDVDTTPLSLEPNELAQVGVNIVQCVGQGTYNETIRMVTNDEENPIYELPVSLFVTGDGEPPPTLTPTQTVDVTPTVETPTNIPTWTATPTPTNTGTSATPSSTPEVTGTPYPTPVDTPTPQPTSEWPRLDSVTFPDGTLWEVIRSTIFLPFTPRGE